MNKKFSDYYIFSAAVLLFVTAAAKLFAAAGTGAPLNDSDTVFQLSNRQVFWLAGGLELGLSAFLLMKEGWPGVKLMLIAWLATGFLLYRAGLWFLGAPSLCVCLGNLNAQFPLSPRFTNVIMLAGLTWLLAGSGLLLLRDRPGRAPVRSRR